MAEPKKKLFAVKFIWVLQASKMEFKPSNDDYSAYALYFCCLLANIYMTQHGMPISNLLTYELAYFWNFMTNKVTVIHKTCMEVSLSPIR